MMTISSKNISWTLKDLCDKIDDVVDIVGDSNVTISGLQLDNRRVQKNDAFFCIVGYKTDGHKFAQEAVKAGASCLFVEKKLDGIPVAQVIVKNTRLTMAKIAAKFYNYPSNKLKIIGITGTNGKTTITNIVDHVIRTCKKSCAILGTNGIKINGQTADSDKYDFVGRTTPEAYQLQKIYYNLLKDNVEFLIMEVSAHALTLNRVLGTNFYITAFTNLSQDHLDFYDNMQDYFEAKAKLFSSKFMSHRIICIDDQWGKSLFERSKDQITENDTYSMQCKVSENNNIKKNNNIIKEYKVISTSYDQDSNYVANKLDIDFPLIGKYNKQNMVLSYAICKCLDFNDQQIKSALATMPQVDGRMQVVSNNSQLPKVIVDYAHTPDALLNALQAISDFYNQLPICVFGCGGDRDSDKRPKMGKIAALNSKFCIVTSDNPRSENPQQIISQIIKGMQNCDNYKVEQDRKKAIFLAIDNAKSSDIILIAGKGHEKYQEINGKQHPFDDVEIAKEALNQKLTK